MYGNRIREARKKKGMTLKQVADATGYTIGHISQIERNLKSPSLSARGKETPISMYMPMEEPYTLEMNPRPGETPLKSLPLKLPG